MSLWLNFSSFPQPLTEKKSEMKTISPGEEEIHGKQQEKCVQTLWCVHLR